MEPGFRHEPDPEMPGWRLWELVSDAPVFNAALGPLRTCADGPNRGRVRCWPRPQHGNTTGHVHGGFIVAFLDAALFAGAAAAGLGTGVSAVTLELSHQFVFPGRIGEPLDALIEVVRETKRLVFLRGTMEQGPDVIGAFSGLLSKLSPPQ